MSEDYSSLENRVKALEERLDMLGENSDAITQKSQNQSSKKLSLKEFMMKYRPDSDVERTLVIGGYLEQHQGLTSFTVEDIRQGFRAARISQPSNPNHKINQNIKKGLIMESDKTKDGKKAWMLTATGETKLEEGLNSGVEK